MPVFQVMHTRCWIIEAPDANAAFDHIADYDPDPIVIDDDWEVFQIEPDKDDEIIKVAKDGRPLKVKKAKE